MIWSILILCFALLYREYMFNHERKAWANERKDLYSRIQAGTLQEYVATTKEPTAAVVKDREQRIAEYTAEHGLQRQDLQYPAHWSTKG